MNKSIEQETALYLADKANKRLAVICAFLALALILSNLAWVIYEKQFEVVEETTEEYYDIDQQADNYGQNNYFGRDGEANYGTTENPD